MTRVRAMLMLPAAVALLCAQVAANGYLIAYEDVELNLFEKAVYRGEMRVPNEEPGDLFYLAGKKDGTTQFKKVIDDKRQTVYYVRNDVYYGEYYARQLNEFNGLWLSTTMLLTEERLNRLAGDPDPYELEYEYRESELKWKDREVVGSTRRSRRCCYDRDGQKVFISDWLQMDSRQFRMPVSVVDHRPEGSELLYMTAYHPDFPSGEQDNDSRLGARASRESILVRFIEQNPDERQYVKLAVEKEDRTELASVTLREAQIEGVTVQIVINDAPLGQHDVEIFLTRGEVTLTVDAERNQPAGWPVVVEVTLTNIGKEPIFWGCGGPDLYPGAERFLVQLRYGGEDQWRTVAATNGQYRQGSSINQWLEKEQSIIVPLAIPIEREGSVFLRIQPREWQAAATTEASVRVRRESRYLDRRRARAIRGALQEREWFWQHMAATYADEVVIDAMLKMVTVDNPSVAAGAAQVLARQPSLPETAGESLAQAVDRWHTRPPRTERGGPRWYVVTAALKTESEAARRAVIDLIQSETDARERGMLIHSLRASPGDADWLRRARAALLDLRRERPDDTELAQQVDAAVEMLDARITPPEVILIGPGRGNN